MDPKARNDTIDKINAIFEFIIKNDAGKVQTWTADLKNRPGSLLLGKGPQKADILLEISDSDFVKLAKGELNGQKAYLSGKLAIKGNIMLATKLDYLMRSTTRPRNKS